MPALPVARLRLHAVLGDHEELVARRTLVVELQGHADLAGRRVELEDTCVRCGLVELILERTVVARVAIGGAHRRDESPERRVLRHARCVRLALKLRQVVVEVDEHHIQRHPSGPSAKVLPRVARAKVQVVDGVALVVRSPTTSSIGLLPRLRTANGTASEDTRSGRSSRSRTAGRRGRGRLGARLWSRAGCARPS